MPCALCIQERCRHAEQLQADVTQARHTVQQKAAELAQQRVECAELRQRVMQQGEETRRLEEELGRCNSMIAGLHMHINSLMQQVSKGGMPNREHTVDVMQIVVRVSHSTPGISKHKEVDV